MATDSPREHKQLGRMVANFNKDTWERVAQDVVYRGCYYKFTQNPDLREILLATGETLLVEASPSDCIWGVGLSGSDPRIEDRNQWRGTNWLGEVLTLVREKIKQ